MQQFIGPATPRDQLPFEQLPRGFVPFPERVTDAVRNLEQKAGRPFTDRERHESLVQHVLSYFYEDYPVAYREAENGIEVLGVGFEEVAKFWRTPEPGVKVTQP